MGVGAAVSSGNAGHAPTPSEPEAEMLRVLRLRLRRLQGPTCLSARPPPGGRHVGLTRNVSLRPLSRRPRPPLLALG